MKRKEIAKMENRLKGNSLACVLHEKIKSY